MQFSSLIVAVTFGNLQLVLQTALRVRLKLTTFTKIREVLYSAV